MTKNQTMIECHSAKLQSAASNCWVERSFLSCKPCFSIEMAHGKLGSIRMLLCILGMMVVLKSWGCNSHHSWNGNFKSCCAQLLFFSSFKFLVAITMLLPMNKKSIICIYIYMMHPWWFVFCLCLLLSILSPFWCTPKKLW